MALKRLLPPFLIVLAMLGMVLPSANASAAPCAEVPAAGDDDCCCPADDASPEGRESEQGCADGCDTLCRALCGHAHATAPAMRLRIAAAEPVFAPAATPQHPVDVEGPAGLFRPPRPVL